MNHNYAAIKLLTDRYSAQIKMFNYQDVTETDSDEQYFLYKELETMVTVALQRAPKFKPSGNRMALRLSTDLGNVRMEALRHMNSSERARYDAIQVILNDLYDKYND